MIEIVVAARDRLVEGEGIAAGARRDFHPVEEDTRVDLVDLAAFDRVLKLAERRRRAVAELLAGDAC